MKTRIYELAIFVLTVGMFFFLFKNYETQKEVRTLRQEQIQYMLKAKQKEQIIRSQNEQIKRLNKQISGMKKLVYNATGEVPAYD